MTQETDSESKRKRIIITEQDLDKDAQLRQVFIPKGRRETAPFSTEPKEVAERLKAKNRVVHVFTDGPDTEFDVQSLQQWLTNTVGGAFTIQLEGSVIEYAHKQGKSKNELAEAFAAANFAESYTGTWLNSPVDQSTKKAYELTYLHTDARDYHDHSRANAVQTYQGPRPQRAMNFDLYDTTKLGQAYTDMLQDLIQADEEKQHSVLVVTGRGIGNKEMLNGRSGVHLRAASQTGGLAIISTSGLVNAPGKPLEVSSALGSDFYMDRIEDEERQKKVREYINENGLSGATKQRAIEIAYQDQMLHHHDARLTEAAKGITLSMILYSHGEVHGKVACCGTSDLESGEPDTDRQPCRLFDAHWQQELLHHQGGDNFCSFHQELLDELRQ